METATQPPTTSAPREKQHLPGLDGLRGLAILAVMGHHLVPPNYPHGIPGGLAGIVVKTIYRFFDVGWWGVDLFFVLSGFLITGILLEAKGSARYFGNFYARRSLRIFPLYYGVLALLFFVLPWLATASLTGAWTEQHAGDLLAIGRENAPLQNWLWFYGTNIRTALATDGWAFGKLTHFWSLAVEEHFYLLWPMVVYFCSTRTLARVCLALAGAAILCRAGLFVGGLAPAYIYVSSPCRFDGLALGAFVAALTQLWRNHAATASSEASPTRPGIGESLTLLWRLEPPAGAAVGQLRAPCRRLFVVLLPVTVLVILTCPRFGAFLVIIGHTLFAATFAVGLPGAALATRSSSLANGGWLGFAPLQFLGKYSYGLYVLHPFIVEPIEKLITTDSVQSLVGHSYVLTAILRYSLALPVSLLIAWAVWHGFEKHFLRLKHFFPATSPARAHRGEAADVLAPTLSPAK